MARSFAGGTDTIRYIDDASDHFNVPGVTGCTIAARFRTSSSTANATMIGHVTAASRQGFLVYITAGGKAVLDTYAGAANTGSVIGATTVNNGAWHTVFAIMRFTSGTLNEIYIDGAADGSFNASGTWQATASNTFVMGDSLDAFWGSYTGELADVGYWSVALTAGDAAAYHRGMSPSRIMPSKLMLYTPLVRDTACRRGSQQTSISGTTITDHPRVIGSLV